MDKTQDIPGFRKLAAATERLQSENIMTAVFPRAMRRLQRAYSKIDDVVPGLAGELGAHDRRLATVLEDAVRGAWNADEIDQVLRSENVALNLETLLRRTADNMGVDSVRLSRYVDDSVHETVRVTLENLGPNPSEQTILEAFDDIDLYVQGYIDEMVAANLPEVLEEAAAKSHTEGGTGVLQLLGEIADTTYARHADHMAYLDDAIESTMRIKDRFLQNRAWKATLSSADMSWGRHWDWSEAVMRGIEKGLRSRGMDVPDSFMDAFLNLRKGSQTYITRRNKAWTSYFDQIVSGKLADPLDRIEAAAKIYDEMDRLYVKLTDLTVEARREMDMIFELVTPAQISPEVTQGVTAWRTAIRRMVRRDMERVLEQHQNVRGLSREMKAAEWRLFNEQRKGTHLQILQMEELGRAMVNGDEDALRFFLQQAEAQAPSSGDDVVDLARQMFLTRQAAARVDEPALELLERAVSGEQLTAEEVGQVNRIAKQFMSEPELAEFDDLMRTERLAGQSVRAELPPDVMPEMVPEIRRAFRTVGDRVEFEGMVGNPYFRGAGDRIYRFDPSVPNDELRANLEAVADVLQTLGRKAEGDAVANLAARAADAGDESALAALFGGEIGRVADAEQAVLRGGLPALAVNDVVAAPIESLPEPLREQLRYVAREMLEEIQYGEPGSRNWRYEIGPGIGEQYNISTGYPSWYGQLFQEFPHTQRARIIEVLEQIIAGEGDSGVWAERLKSIALQEVISGPRRQPGADPLVLRILGRPEDEVAAALRAWEQAGYDILGEAAASRQAGIQRLYTSALERLYQQVEAGAAQVGEAARSIDNAAEAAPGMPNLPEFDRVVGRQLFLGTGLDELWFEQGGTIVRNMRDEAVRMANEPPLRFQALPEATLAKVRRYLDHMVGEMRETRFAATRVAEGMRDMGLLNYSRTYNFDNWLGVLMPFHFWWTHSIGRWALGALDRPWVLANYFRAKLFLESAVGEQQAFPQRLRGHVKIEMPFLPDEIEAIAGDLFVNPFRTLGLPFEQFTQPFERWQQVTTTQENRTIRKLDEMLASDEISNAEYELAVSTKQGQHWEWAQALVTENDQSLRFDLMDFMNLSISPHIPAQMIWNLARGTPEELNPLPHTRSLKHLGTLLGIDPGIYDNVWGNVREHFGLPAFDQWGDYRVRRELSNMIGEGAVVNGQPVSKDEILLAMATQSGPLYELAAERVDKVEALRFASRFFGIPLNPYPPGEQAQRALYDEFFGAMELRDQGDDRAVGRFFDEHPEFEARLALWKEPEEQLQSFLVDQIWNWWWDAPRLHRDEAIRQLGPLFERAFVDQNTRATEAIPLDTLIAWTHLLGGTAPGQLELSADIAPIAFSDPVIAHQLQTFYDTRARNFRYSDQIWPLWQEYFRLDEGEARDRYWDQHPILQTYVDWRRDFMLRNPDLIPYIEDDPERQPTFPSVEALREAQAAQPNLVPIEWERALGQPSYNLVIDYLNGEPMPPVTRNKLDDLAAGLGLDDWLDVVERVAQAIGRPVPSAPSPGPESYP